MNIHIRKGTLEDLPQLAIINGMGTEGGVKMAEERLPAFISSNNLIVAEDDSKIIGLLYWERKFLGEDNWFLTQITITEEHRRKGIGESLWREFLSIAKQGGASAVFCDVYEENLASKNLALKIGGIVVGSIDLGAGDKRVFYRFDLR